MPKEKKSTQSVSENIEQPSALSKYSKELVATLKKYPHIDCVYIDEEGYWHFAQKPGLFAISREEILNG
jgi:RNA:NAD 2'-phosphotransferase (TPT1/KptA family)